MIVYREVSNGEGYTVDPNGLATVPYGTDNETSFVDDQQAPMFVYRDQQQQQPIMSDGMPQQIFFNQDQDGVSLINNLINLFPNSLDQLFYRDKLFLYSLLKINSFPIE
jgi:hypothetical protein